MIVQVPTLAAVIRPLSSTVAMLSSLEDHRTLSVVGMTVAATSAFSPIVSTSSLSLKITDSAAAFDSAFSLSVPGLSLSVCTLELAEGVFAEAVSGVKTGEE